ncbi:MAG TPA: hypothetical protein VKA08_06615 [Balneolales bacterium]|nr:hypothetical protein [Balneolales bacterium]
MKTILFVIVTQLLIVVSLPVYGFQIEPQNPKADNTRITIRIVNDSIPLAKRKRFRVRPKFETIHLVLGFGVLNSDYSDLRMLELNPGNISVPMSIYIHVPLTLDSPAFFFTGGWDIGLGGGTNSFKGLLMFQSPYRIMLGFGGGTSIYSYKDDNIIIGANQSYPILAGGINLSRQRVDLLVTLPLAPSLKQDFEGSRYSIRPAVIQVSLLISLR